MHLGLTGAADAEALTALWNTWPQLTLGHAVPRRDRWARLAPRLGRALAAALPPDPGILAYLAQLDLDLLLLGSEPTPHSVEEDYVSASRSLRLPVAVIAGSAEAVLAQAATGAVPPPPPQAAAIHQPALWALWAWDELAHPAQTETAGDGEVSGGVGHRLAEAYASRIFPSLAGAAAALAPESRPLLKADVAGRLDRRVLANALSAERAMAEAAEGRGMIAVGPWWDDPELEILYWAPFVRWWRRRYQVDKDRIVVISGGGSAAWYDGALGQHLDLRELYDPQALADLLRSRAEELSGRRKRFGITDADRQVLKRLNRRLGFRGLKTLPPWAMAVQFERYWSGEAGPALLADRTRAQPLKMKDKRARQLVPGLPPEFVAVGLPDRLASESGLRMGLKAMIRRAAERTGVVLLAEPACAAWAAQLSGGPIQVLALDPATAKSTVSAAVAASIAHIGPAGWMAYTAAAYGRPAICLGEGSNERELIDMAAAARLFPRAPLLIGLEDIETARAGLELIIAGAAPAEPAH